MKHALIAASLVLVAGPSPAAAATETAGARPTDASGTEFCGTSRRSARTSAARQGREGLRDRGRPQEGRHPARGHGTPKDIPSGARRASRSR